jgi:uncharacterized protein YkwD
VTPDELEVVRRINAFRRAHRLTTVIPNPDLEDVARDHSRRMRDERFFDHRNFKRRIGDEWTSAAEAIFAADLPIDSPANCVEAWKDSPPHRHNLLGDFAFVGIGRVASDKRAFWTADLAR